MSKNSFLLVDLKDDSSKSLAQTLQNKSCRQILDYLANHSEATESQLSKALKIPLSTVHYNMQALLKAKLITADEYHYSTKGREVNHYKLANQYIIIAPQESHSKFKQALKNIIPLAAVAAGGSLIIRWLTKVESSAMDTVSFGAQKAMEVAPQGIVQEVAPEALSGFMPTYNPALWFLFGAIFIILIYILWSLRR
jgi:DNA-binding transcriptional ArsR family regulator